MVKINILLSKQTSMQSQLEENNLELEQEFRAKLKVINKERNMGVLKYLCKKTAELESIHLEQKIENLQDEREKALQGLIESE